MKTDVAFVQESERAWAAAALMRDKNVGFLPVCDQAGRVVGTLTDRDLAIRVVADGISSDRNVAELMTREIVSCGPDDDIDRAEELMMQEQKFRIMCLDDNGHLAGVISISDLAEIEAPDRAGDVLAEIVDREVTP